MQVENFTEIVDFNNQLLDCYIFVLKHSLNSIRTEPSLLFNMFFRMPTVTESEWPAYTRDHPKYFIWNAEEKEAFGRGPRTTACAFWNEFLPRLKGIPGT